MFTINGKHTVATVMIDNLDPETMKQITITASHPSATNPIAIMPDAHAGKGNLCRQREAGGSSEGETVKIADFNIAVKNLRQECLIFRANNDWGDWGTTKDGKPYVLKGDTLILGWGFEFLNIRNDMQIDYPVSSMTLLGTMLATQPRTSLCPFGDTLREQAYRQGFKETT